MPKGRSDLRHKWLQESFEFRSSPYQFPKHSVERCSVYREVGVGMAEPGFSRSLPTAAVIDKNQAREPSQGTLLKSFWPLDFHRAGWRAVDLSDG